MRNYVKALVQRDRLTAALEKFLGDWDAWICPVVAMPAFPHHKYGRRFVVDRHSINYLSAIISFACIFNLTGSPVVALPIGMSQAGLPIGVQVVGRRWHDMQLLSVAETLTEVTGACRRPPGY